MEDDKLRSTVVTHSDVSFSVNHRSEVKINAPLSFSDGSCKQSLVHCDWMQRDFQFTPITVSIFNLFAFHTDISACVVVLKGVTFVKSESLYYFFNRDCTKYLPLTCLVGTQHQLRNLTFNTN